MRIPTRWARWRRGESFAAVYGKDWRVDVDPGKLLPTVGATGGISLMCSLFERPGAPLAYITDAPTYAGFLARATLNRHASIYSVDLDDEGPLPDGFRDAVRRARADGRYVPFYYTVPDGHNPAGISFSMARREAVLDIAREEGRADRRRRAVPLHQLRRRGRATAPVPRLGCDADRASLHRFEDRSAGAAGGFPLHRSGSGDCRRRTSVASRTCCSRRRVPTFCFRIRRRCGRSSRCCSTSNSNAATLCGPWRRRSSKCIERTAPSLLDGLQAKLGGYPSRFPLDESASGLLQRL